MNPIRNLFSRSMLSAKYRNMLTCFIGAAMFFGIGCANKDDNVIKTLYYPNAHNVTYYRSIIHCTFTMNYVVDLKYPSLAVLEYYDKRLGELGWAQFSEKKYENNYRMWSSYVDGKRKGNPVVHELIAMWTNANRSRMIMLGLRYYSYGVDKGKDSAISPNNSTQEITLQVMPFTVLS